MHVDVPLARPAAQAVFMSSVLALCGLSLYFAVCDFLVSALSDPSIAVAPGAPLGSFVTDPFTGGGANPLVFDAIGPYIPNSPRLHYKLADSELNRSERDLRSVELHAIRAAHLSP